MTDKEKFRKEVEKLKSNLLYGACSSQIAMETMCKEEAYNEVLAILDTMQEEAVSDTQSPVVLYGLTGSVGNTKEEPQVKESAEIQHVNETCKENGNSLTQEPVSEDLETFAKKESEAFAEREYEIDYIDRNALRKGYYWGCIDGAKWQAEQFEKNRLAACDRQAEEEAEIERDFVMGIIENEHRQPTYDDAIKYGMRLQKEQMMAKAIDGEIGYWNIRGLSVNMDLPRTLKEDDRVKLIIIKED